MAIKDQCSRCSYYSGSICKFNNSYPSFDQTSCGGYKRSGIELGKETTNSPAHPNQTTPSPTPSPHTGSNNGNNYYGNGNNNYAGNPYNGGRGVANQEPFFDSLISFSGRSRRTRYWLTSFFCSGVMIALVFMGAILSGGDEGGAAFGYILGIIPCMAISLANGTKRLHDLGHTGWLQLLLFIPFINFGLGIYMAFFEGQRFDNQYGPSPY